MSHSKVQVIYLKKLISLELPQGDVNYKRLPGKSNNIKLGQFVWQYHTSRINCKTIESIYIYYTTNPNEHLSSNGRAPVEQVCQATVEQLSSNHRATIEHHQATVEQFFFTRWALDKQKKNCFTVTRQLLDGCSMVLNVCSTVVRQLLGRLARWLLDHCSTSSHWD